MDTYYVTRIEEPDFGCEGRPEGQEIKDKVYLKEEITKEETIIFMEDKLLYERDINEGMKVVLAKPQTYMNLSGESVAELVNYYKIDEEHELLVIYDDISLDVGQLRIRKKGSAGGHNGIKNIIANLGTDVFPRIKIGVGEKPKKYDLADYVLSRFSKEDRVLMEDAFKDASKAVNVMITESVDAAMNQFNGHKG